MLTLIVEVAASVREPLVMVNDGVPDAYVSEIVPTLASAFPAMIAVEALLLKT